MDGGYFCVDLHLCFKQLCTWEHVSGVQDCGDGVLHFESLHVLFHHLMLQIIKCTKVKIKRLPVGPSGMGFNCVFNLAMGTSSVPEMWCFTFYYFYF